MWLVLPLLNRITVGLQAELKVKENQVADLQENVKSQQAETSKAKEELTSALGSMEQLKEGFAKERADWATEKAALTKKIENTEAVLKPVTDELTSVKRQVHAMAAAIFGKLPITCVMTLILLQNSSVYDLLTVLQALASITWDQTCV